MGLERKKCFCFFFYFIFLYVFLNPLDPLIFSSTFSYCSSLSLYSLPPLFLLIFLWLNPIGWSMELVLPEKSNRKQHLQIRLLFQYIMLLFLESGFFFFLELLQIERRNNKWNVDMWQIGKTCPDRTVDTFVYFKCVQFIRGPMKKVL